MIITYFIIYVGKTWNQRWIHNSENMKVVFIYVCRSAESELVWCYSKNQGICRKSENYFTAFFITGTEQEKLSTAWHCAFFSLIWLYLLTCSINLIQIHKNPFWLLEEMSPFWYIFHAFFYHLTHQLTRPHLERTDFSHDEIDSKDCVFQNLSFLCYYLHLPISK